MKSVTLFGRWPAILALVTLCGCEGDGCSGQGLVLSGDYEFPRNQSLENAVTLYLTADGLEVLEELSVQIMARMLGQDDYRFDFSDFVTDYLVENPISLFDFSLRDVEVLATLPDGIDSLDISVLGNPTRIHVYLSRLWISIEATVYDDTGDTTSACRIAPDADVGDEELYSLVLEGTEIEIVLGTTSTGELQLSANIIELGLVDTDLTVITDEDDPDYYCNLPECMDGCGECILFCTGMDLLIDVGEFVRALFQGVIDEALEIIVNLLLEELQVVQGQMHPALLAGDLINTLYDANWLGFMLGPGRAGFQAIPIDGVPTSMANELLLGLAVGVESQAHPCIGKDQTNPVWNPPEPYELDTSDIEPHMVLALADTMIDQALWGAFKSGSLCLLLESSLVSRFTDRFSLSAGLLSLLLPGLERIAERSAPLLISIQPVLDAMSFPLVDLRRDEDGETLFGLSFDALDVGFYAWVQGRYLRLFEVRTAVSVTLSPTVLPDNQIQIAVADLQASLLQEQYNELFTGVNLVELVNFALELATATLIESGQGITVSISDLVQDLTGLPVVPTVLRLGAAQSNDRWLELALRLDAAAQRSSAKRRVDTEVEVLDLEPGAVTLRVTAPGFADDEIEYQARWGFGAFTDFRPAGETRLESTFLLFPGQQAIEVRARARGDYRSLDMDPATAVIEVPEWDRLPAPGDPLCQSGAETGGSDPPDLGCRVVARHGSPVHWTWLVAALWLIVRRRRLPSVPAERR